MSQVIEQNKNETETAAVGLQFSVAVTGQKTHAQTHTDNECKHPATPRQNVADPMHPYGLD